MQELHTLQELINTFAGRGQHPAILALQKEGMTRWTYAELGDHVQRLANGLTHAGLSQGDRVALLANNAPEWIIACLSIIQAGAVVVPLDAQLGGEILGHILDDAKPRFIFTTARKSEQLAGLDTEVQPTPILLDAEADDERGWRSMLRAENGTLPQVTADDPAMLFYTSGTTGPPKGVPLNHRNLAFQLNTIRRVNLVSSEDRVLQPLPMHHVYPLVGTFGPLVYGAPLVLPQSLTGPQLVRALKEGQVSLLIGVPRLYNALYENIQERLRSQGPVASVLLGSGIDLSTWLYRRTGTHIGKWLLRPLHQRFGPALRTLVSGGSAIDPELARKLEGLGWQIFIGYGLTETAPLLTIHPPGEGRLDTVGKPIDGVELRIDPSAHPGEEETGNGQPTSKAQTQGEVQARGPNVFAGYHNLPDKTAKTFTEDGRFRTGDLGYLDDDGYLHITGRTSTLIVTPGGENIQPDAVEATYEEDPVIDEIGVLQQEGQLVAVIVPDMRAIRERNGDIDDAIRKAVDEGSQRLPSYQRIADYATTREPLPRTRLGKIRRHLLAERYEQAKQQAQQPDTAPGHPIAVEEMSDADQQLLKNHAARQVWDWFAGHHPDQRLTPDTSLQLDLGIDSLEWLNLTLEIEQRANVELSDDAITRVETVRDLLQEVAEQAEAGHTVSKARPLEQPEEVLSAEQARWLEPLSLPMRLLSRGTYALNWGMLHGPFRLQVRGQEHLQEGEQFVFAPNHVSYLDAFALAAALPYARLRRTYWGGSARIAFHNPLYSLVSRLAQTVPIDHRHAVISSLAFGAAILRRNYNLIWFPEGHRSPDGELLDFRPGIGMLPAHYSVPVVPIFIQGTDRAMPMGRAIPRPAQITVTFGTPLDPHELEQQAEGEQAHDRIANALRRHTLELSRAA